MLKDALPGTVLGGQGVAVTVSGGHVIPNVAVSAVCAAARLMATCVVNIR